MKKYVFDVDGTLTPSRCKIDEEFLKWFKDFCIRNEVYLVTGSDYEKTREQLGDDLLRWPIFVYNCSGSDVWAKGKRVKSDSWKVPEELMSTLEMFLENSRFKLRTGKHIELRPGTLNFSIVGRNASVQDRHSYVEWDLKTKEREILAKKINTLFPNLNASVGGETGLDIYPKGKDKSQILKDFDEDDIIYFFGDRMEPTGNDYPLGSKLKSPSKAFHVKDWQHTFELLKEIGD
jgi:phosphomannomutase